MDTVSQILTALGDLGPELWLLIVLGVVLGLLVGVLPGLTFVMGVLLILPFTYGMGTEAAIVLMLAVYVAGTYGGAITSVLLHIPGEPNNVPLLWDGHNMTRQGRAAEALGWAATAALVGGLASWLILAFAAQPFADIALRFGQEEYFVIVLLGLTSVLALVERSVVKALVALVGGMLLATVGVDLVYGQVRFDVLGVAALRDGVDYLAVMIGVYALGDVIQRFAQNFKGGTAQQPSKVRTTVPGLNALRSRLGSFVRGTTMGATMGLVPGAGATVASFVAYGLEKQFGRDKANVGNSSPNGIIAPQAASTATVPGAMIPMLVLGIPGSAATAVILGALLLHDVQPGPEIFNTQAGLVYTIIAALLVSLVVMFAVGILATKPLIRLLKVPETYIAVFVVLFAYIGAFALRQSMSDVWIMTGFAILGFFMTQGGYPLAPLVLGAILGPLAERYYVTTMISSAGDWTVFFTRPISGSLMVVWVLVVFLIVSKSYRQWRRAKAPATPAEQETERAGPAR